MQQSILAVDDEPYILVLLERIIRERTVYNIMTTSNGLEVPKILQEHTFDLVVTDFKMPGMSGMDLLRMIKDQHRQEEVIMITAYGTLESAVTSIALDVFDYITKPFTKEQFLLSVERAMRLQRVNRELKTLSGIFRIEPYDEALEKFEREYVRQLRDRSGQDDEVMVERSGLSKEFLRARLQEPGAESG